MANRKLNETTASNVGNSSNNASNTKNVVGSLTNIAGERSKGNTPRSSQNNIGGLLRMNSLSRFELDNKIGQAEGNTQSSSKNILVFSKPENRGDDSQLSDQSISKRMNQTTRVEEAQINPSPRHRTQQIRNPLPLK